MPSELKLNADKFLDALSALTSSTQKFKKETVKTGSVIKLHEKRLKETTEAATNYYKMLGLSGTQVKKLVKEVKDSNDTILRGSKNYEKISAGVNKYREE